MKFLKARLFIFEQILIKIEIILRILLFLKSLDKLGITLAITNSTLSTYKSKSY